MPYIAAVGTVCVCVCEPLGMLIVCLCMCVCVCVREPVGSVCFVTCVTL